MGGGFSKANSVWLQCDKPIYSDGDYVQGVVCFNVTEEVTVTQIDCELLGTERTWWTRSEDRNFDGDNRIETYGGTVHMLNVSVPLGGAGRSFVPGQYEWPILFALPPGLPSSFLITKSSEGAEVAFTVNLTFQTPGFLTRTIRGSQAITVRQRMSAPPSILEQSAELELLTCCCINRGSVSARVQLDRDRCQPGEEVVVILDLDNGSSKLPVDAIELCLKRQATAYDRPGLKGSRNTLNKEYAKAKHPGCPPFTVLQGGTARRMSLRLPDDLQPSMRGALIVCEYFVTVKLNIGSMVKDVKLKVPLVVLAPQPVPTPEAPFYSEPPPFWKPSPDDVQPPQGIAVPSAPLLPPEMLRPDAPFWTQSMGNSGAHAAAAAAAAAVAVPAVPAAAAAAAAPGTFSGTGYQVV